MQIRLNALKADGLVQQRLRTAQSDSVQTICDRNVALLMRIPEFLHRLCTLVIHLLELSVAQSTFAQMAEQGLFILGWVALWRPLEIFLYDWWPLARRIRLLERLSAATVEIRSR